MFKSVVSLEFMNRKILDKGVKLLDTESLDIIKRYVKSRKSEGGWRGRSDKEDLYYTYFAAEIMRAFNDLPEDLPEIAAESAVNFYNLDMSHRVCLVKILLMYKKSEAFTLFFKKIINSFEDFRSSSKGFVLNRTDSADSVYALYLLYTAFDSAGIKLCPDFSLNDYLMKKKSSDNGLTDRDKSNCGITTVTAAGQILLMRILKKSDRELTDWLLKRYDNRSGGFTGSCSVMAPDLLSSAAALSAIALTDPSGIRNEKYRIRDFVESLWQEDGGFSAVPSDLVTDVEYTYYALLCLGITEVL